MFKIPAINLPDILTGQLLTYFPYYGTWSVEPYIKCAYKCTYCYSDAQGLAHSHISLENLEESLSQDFIEAAQYTQIFNIDTPIILSCHTDPYQPIEATTGITRHILEYLIRNDHQIAIVTRSPLVLRDLDILVGHKEKVKVSVSLPFSRQEYIDKYEREAPTLEERLHTIQCLHAAGIDVTVRISPWIPEVTDIRAIFQLLPQDTQVIVSPLYLHEGTKNLFYRSDTPPLNNDNSSALMAKIHTFASGGGSNIASRYFSNLSQEDIIDAYIRERNAIGFRRKTLWDYPILPDEIPASTNLRHLKPNELQPRQC